MSEIKIKAKKISDISSIDNNFSINQFGKFAYLLLSYKDNNSLPQNFKISLDQLATAILNKNGTITESEIRFIKDIMQNGDYIYQEDIDNTTSEPYIFTYALETDFTQDSGIFYINNIINSLNYTQGTRGVLPDSSGPNDTGFCIKNYTLNNNEHSFKWDERVVEGNVWIIIPAQFFDRTTNSFLDNESHKYKICDALIKEPIEPVDIKTTTWNGVQYVLYCFSQNGATGKVYFRKIA